MQSDAPPQAFATFAGVLTGFTGTPVSKLPRQRHTNLNPRGDTYYCLTFAKISFSPFL